MIAKAVKLFPYINITLDGGTIRGYCERKRPNDSGFLVLAFWGLETLKHGAKRLNEITRRPDRIPRSTVDDEDDEDETEAAWPSARPSMPTVDQGNERQRAAVNERNRALREAAMKTDGAEMLTTFVRMPAVPEELGSRPLPLRVSPKDTPGEDPRRPPWTST